MIRPIIFSPAMIAALLAGRKTQTRRPLKPQPKVLRNGVWYRPYSVLRPRHWHYLLGDRICGFVEVPYAHGDLLWVREPWQALAEFDRMKPSELPVGSDILYTADRPDMLWDARKRHARFMPRWASRLTLKVTDIRVQRLQDISEADALAEGAHKQPSGWYSFPGQNGAGTTGRAAFALLWNSVYGHDAWQANPWVCAISFEVIRKNVGEVAQ